MPLHLRTLSLTFLFPSTEPALTKPCLDFDAHLGQMCYLPHSWTSLFFPSEEPHPRCSCLLGVLVHISMDKWLFVTSQVTSAKATVIISFIKVRTHLSLFLCSLVYSLSPVENKLLGHISRIHESNRST